MMLVTPAQKQKVTSCSEQFQFYNNKIENFGKIWVVDAEYLRFNCFYSAAVISAFGTASLIFFR